MPLRILLLVALLAVAVAATTPAPPAEARDCRVRCYTVECWPIPGGRRCRRRCERRCWEPPPRNFVPYYQPAAPLATDIRSYVAVGVVAAGALLILGVIAAATRHLGIFALRRQAAEVDAETRAANSLAAAAHNLTRDIDAYVETTKRTAYQRGRDSL